MPHRSMKKEASNQEKVEAEDVKDEDEPLQTHQSHEHHCDATSDQGDAHEIHKMLIDKIALGFQNEKCPDHS